MPQKIKRYFFILAIQVLSSVSLLSQVADLRPIQLNQGHVNDILRDRDGFIWVATQNGLSYFDGGMWKTYFHDRKDQYSLSNNYVWVLKEGADGHIWIGTFGGGLNKFDKSKQQFSTFFPPKDGGSHEIRAIHEISSQQLLIGTDNGLYIFDKHNEVFIHDSVFLANQQHAGIIHFQNIIPYTTTEFLIGSENGPYYVNIASKEVKPIKLGGKVRESMCRILPISEEYLVSHLAKVYRCRLDDKAMKFVVNSQKEVSKGASISTLKAVSRDEVFIGHSHGLHLYYTQNDSLGEVNLSQKDTRQHADSYKVIYSIAKIEEELYYVGTAHNIIQMRLGKPLAKHLTNEELGGGTLLGLAIDEEENIWACSRDGLIRIQERATGGFAISNFRTNDFPEIKSNYLLNIAFFENNGFIGTRKEGFAHFSKRGENIIWHEIPASVSAYTASYSVNCFARDKAGYVWIGTSGNGAVRWHIEKNHVEHYPFLATDSSSLSHPYVFALHNYDDKNMLVGTAAGLNVVDHSTGAVRQILSHANRANSLSGDFILDIHEDKNSRLWVATTTGLNRMHEDFTFTSWMRSDGLPNDLVYGIESDNKNLYLTTNDGLVKVHVERDDSITMKIFRTNDGMLNDQYDQFSFCKRRAGEFIFGTPAGLSFFYPERIFENTINARASITAFQLFNQDATMYFDRHINEIDKIELNHDENFIGFNLSAQSFWKPEENQFRYKMIGLSDAFISLENRKFLSFNGLKPGAYTLQIQAANSDGKWAQSLKTLDITIRPPWYNTWLAWAAYCLLIASVLYYFYRLKIDKIRSVERAKEQERTRIRERSARDFHDEAGAVITKLSLLTQYLKLSSDGPQARESVLTQMSENVQQLRNGMRDFIWVLDPTHDTLGETVNKIRLIGNTLFEHSAIRFECKEKLAEEKITLNGIQRRQLVLICQEAFINCIKYANATACILEIRRTDSDLSVTISDDGQGFEHEDADSGHGLTNMKVRAAKIKGEFKITSSKGNGTHIVIRLPINPNG